MLQPRGRILLEQITNSQLLSAALVTDFPRSLIEFQQRFGDEAACAQYLAAARWPNGFVCSGCGGGKAWRLETKAFVALAIGKTQQDITAGCNAARPNHVGMAIARHKRAGPIEERDGKLYATQSTRTEQHAAV
jgi:hypothetical protein